MFHSIISTTPPLLPSSLLPLPPLPTLPGTLFLWLFWPSFNGGLASGNAQIRAIINTYFSMTGSVVGTFLFSMLFDKNRKLTMVGGTASLVDLLQVLSTERSLAS